MEVNGLNHATFVTDAVSSEIIEMQQQNSPPVFFRPNVITAQPQGGNHARRPIAVNVQDWITAPASLSALSGTHYLGNVEQLEVQQIVDLSTLLGNAGKGSQYRVKVPTADTLFLAVEKKSEIQSSGFICNKFVRDEHTLNIFDQCGETAFVMKINSTWICSPNKLRVISVRNSKFLGTVEQKFSIIGASFTVYDEARNPLCNIFGPNVCGCCMYAEAEFQVISIDGTYQIASLMHQWDNTLHDYSFLITFPADTDVKLKSLLLGAVFLLEYMYFEH